MGNMINSLLLNSSVESYISLAFALMPVVWLLLSLGFFKLPAYRACFIGLALSLMIATSYFDMPYELAGRAALEGTVLALLPILWVIAAAFYTYNISLMTGAMKRIKNMMYSVSGDRRIQALAIAWGFGGFLESVAGFGTAVAIPASILIALGFEPFFAAVICLIANTIAVAFGVVGIPVTTLAKVTDLPVMPLTLDIALQLTPFVLLVPFLIVYTVTKSWKGFTGVWMITLMAGTSFAVTQFLIAKYVGPEVPAIIGSVISFATIIICARLFPPAKEWRFPHETNKQEANIPYGKRYVKKQIIAWIPYLLLLILVLGTSKLFPFINNSLSQVKSALLIYNGPGGKPLYIDWILTPGTLIMISAILGGLIQGATTKDLIIIFGQTALQLKKTIVTVVCIVSMAKVLGYSGMVSSIAVALANSTGSLYPFFAPLIGALGTFITGSDTSSNVLFGQLQKNVATQIGTDPTWIAAANTSGASAGKLISPQSIAIAAAATGLTGKEGAILNVTVKYVCIFVAALGMLTYWFAF